MDSEDTEVLARLYWDRYRQFLLKRNWNVEESFDDLEEAEQLAIKDGVKSVIEQYIADSF